MSAFDRRSRASRATGAFTLIEVVLVIALLAAVASLAAMTLTGTHQQATHDLALNELNEVRKAVLQFRADTGVLPRQGAFNLSTRANGKVVVSSYPQLPGAPGGTPADVEDWFDAPANVSQLIVKPTFVSGSEHLGEWDPGRRRGWRGPYLSFSTEGWVSMTETWSVRDGVPDAWLDPLPAIADPFHHRVDAEHGFRWTTSTGLAIPDDQAHGRPVLLVDLDQPSLARIVSAGLDGDFVTHDDNVVLYLLR